MVISKVVSEMTVNIPEQCFMRGEDVLYNCLTKMSPTPIIAHMPSVVSTGFRWGFNIYFFDEELNAEQKPITIMPSEGDRINGQRDGLKLDKNGMGAMIIPMGKNDWKAIIFE